jgi:hypothetical protein
VGASFKRFLSTADRQRRITLDEQASVEREADLPRSSPAAADAVMVDFGG